MKQKKSNEAITPDILEAMKERDRYWADGKFEEYKKLRNKINDMIRQAESKLIQTKVDQSRHTGEIWQVMNYITHKGKRKKLFNNIKASSDEFNAYLLSSCDPSHGETTLGANLQPMDSTYVLSNIDQYCKDRNTSSNACNIPLISVLEVGKYISQLSSKKSTGLDSVSPYFLKLSLPYIVESLTFIYNLSITTNTFPTAWKEAKVIPIPKTKTACDMSHFRPISLLSVLSKPLEKHIKLHLYTFMECQNLFHVLQSGFRQNHSCATALTHMCNKWLSSVNESLLNGAVFLDFKKAFDLVNHDLLIKKLRIYSNNESTTSFLSSFLSERKQSVQINGNLSSSRHINKGVPQGSILGPLLFCIYINDLPLHISNPAVDCYLFADDGTLSTADKSIGNLQQTLQTEINNVLSWSEANHMIIHPDKTKSMVISTRQKHQLSELKLNLLIHDKEIQHVDEHKVLGVIIDKELRWEQHIHTICKKVSKNIYLLFKLKPYLDIDDMKKFYLAHCLSHFNYCSTVWGMSKSVSMKKLNQLHRRAGRILLPSDTQTTDEKLKSLDLLPLQKQIEFNTLMQMYKVHTNEAPPYLSPLLTPTQRGSRYLIPKTRIDLFKSSFSFQGPIRWNSLPLDIRLATSLDSFKTRLRSFLIDDHG